MLEKCVLTILEFNWNQRLGHYRTKLNICHHMLTSSTQLQNRSFHVVERTRTSSKCQKMKNARAKREKIMFFIVKYANLWGFCGLRRRGCLSSRNQPRSQGTSRKYFLEVEKGPGERGWHETFLSTRTSNSRRETGSKPADVTSVLCCSLFRFYFLYVCNFRNHDFLQNYERYACPKLLSKAVFS